ncbi:MAG: HAD family hydrolase [Spirochaetaceae bacterium]
MSPTHLLFDVGDTLLQTREYNLERGIEAMLHRSGNAGPKDLKRAMERSRALNDLFNIRASESDLEYSQQAFHRLLYEGLGIEFDDDALELEMVYWDATFRFDPEPGVHDVLAELGRREIPMGIVSNVCFSAEVVRHELEKHDLARFFPFILGSADYGIRKPQPVLFDLGVFKLNAEGHKTAYTGNMVPYDIVGAARAGLLPVWYNRYGHEAELPEGTIVIRHWEDFLEALEFDTPGGG